MGGSPRGNFVPLYLIWVVVVDDDASRFSFSFLFFFWINERIYTVVDAKKKGNATPKMNNPFVLSLVDSEGESSCKIKLIKRSIHKAQFEQISSAKLPLPLSERPTKRI